MSCRIAGDVTTVSGMAAPGGTGPIGPFPPHVADTDEGRDEYDRLRRRVLWTMPYGLYVVGSRAGSALNLMTLNWATQVSFEPKLLAISVEKAAFTHELIAAEGVFALSVIDREDRAIVRKFTKPAELDAEASTLNGFLFRTGASGAPILEQAVAFIDCEVRQTVDCGGHDLFIGEVVDAGFTKAEDTAVLRMEDTRMSYGG
jgi:flavin reductase (DIM6/NTAB) family NADH-FMN oxidoreductase RutF